jgi:hypothetical protein
MAALRMKELLNGFLFARTENEVRKILEDLGDISDVALDEPFGPHNFAWHAFGDNPSNVSSIGLATKPGRSLTERLTNAQDAILEERALPGVSLPQSPQEAARQWFGRPVTGPDEGLFNWDYGSYGYDRRIAVVLTPGGTTTRPNVDVIDDGIGIAADMFPGTILSLQKGNKINKWYVIGSFGQGGASTLAFSSYVLIVSRLHSAPTEAAFTVIRVLNLTEKYKEDAYAYLTLQASDGSFQIPRCEVGKDPLQLYSSVGPKTPTLKKGTLARHYSYSLAGTEKTLSASPGNLYHFLHSSMFDPLFPFRVFDLRDPEGHKDELVSGSRNRLMKLVQKKGGGDEESGSEIRHYRPMEYVVPHGATVPCIGIEYWVVLNYKKNTKTGESSLRGNSNELYVQTGHPIIGTLNGQNQGELTAQILKDVGLGMLSRHMVVHIDASRASSRSRRELFASNREGFKEGDVLNDLVATLKRMLEEDETLEALERELTEKIAKRSAEETSEEVKKHVTRLLIESGFQLKEVGSTVTKGEGEKQAMPRPRRGSKYRKAQPLPTLLFPNVTRFEIVWPKPKMDIHLNDTESIIIETDADAEFDRQDRVAIRCEPPVLEVAGKAPLRGGRLRWRLRPNATATTGAKGRIVVTLTKPDGTQLVDQTEFEVLAALEERTKKIKGYVPPFEIQAINPSDNPEEWSTAWPDLSDEEDPQKLGAVAYRAVSAGGKTYVYYSTIFAPFKEELDRQKGLPGGAILAPLFRTNYEIWIAFHAILQEKGDAAVAGIDEEMIEQIHEQDRVVVAKMQIKQALKTAEVMQQLQRAAA